MELTVRCIKSSAIQHGACQACTQSRPTFDHVDTTSNPHPTIVVVDRVPEARWSVGDQFDLVVSAEHSGRVESRISRVVVVDGHLAALDRHGLLGVDAEQLEEPQLDVVDSVSKLRQRVKANIKMDEHLISECRVPASRT